MDLKRIDNLWNFCKIKTNLPLRRTVDEKEVSYRFIKSGVELSHKFNPHLLQASNLFLTEKGFLDKGNLFTFGAIKKKFGIKTPHIVSSSKDFFPQELLILKEKYNLIIEKDKNGRFRVSISPFIPKNIYEIFKTVNLISLHLWKTIYFSELTKN